MSNPQEETLFVLDVASLENGKAADFVPCSEDGDIIWAQVTTANPYLPPGRIYGLIECRSFDLKITKKLNSIIACWHEAGLIA